MTASKIVLVTPAWRQPGYVGNYRIDRFLRWLSGQGTRLVVVRGGGRDRTESMPWGQEITVADPLRLYRDPVVVQTSAAPPPAPARKPSALRRNLAYWLFNPDPSVGWAWRAARHPAVLAAAEGADWVISTSPPESAHLAASVLARRLGARLLVDMRDGWLDEPLKLLLARSRLRQWREGRLESRILSQAAQILVTSENWREMLTERLPFTAHKTQVLTNAYPVLQPTKNQDRPKIEELTILHAGQLTGARPSHHVQPVLDLLAAGLEAAPASSGKILFLGNLAESERRDLQANQPRFAQSGWRLESAPAVPREQVLAQLAKADGLLLYSASHAAIPSKAFEYIPSGKPVLAACPRGSSVWRMSEGLPQFFVADHGEPARDAVRVAEFFAACRQGGCPYAVPDCYGEPYLSELFLKVVST